MVKKVHICQVGSHLHLHQNDVKSDALADNECKLPLSTAVFEESIEMMEVGDDLGLDDLGACGTSQRYLHS